jgi:hypothetical protein
MKIARAAAFYLAAAVVALVSCLIIIQPGSHASPDRQQPGQIGQHHLTLSPADLGVSALTLPASASSAQSAIIDLRGVQALTLQWNCTQGNTLAAHIFNDDGTTDSGMSANAYESTIVTAASSAQYQLSNMANPIAYANAPGALTTPVTLRLPQRAMSFAFINSGATAGTCTARAYLQY